MPDAHKNFAISTVATAPSPATTGTSLVVEAGTGSRFPAPPFNAVVWPEKAIAVPTNAEVVRVTNVVSNTLTISRKAEGSTARVIVIGDQIADAVTVKTLTDIEEALVTEEARAKAAEKLLEEHVPPIGGTTTQVLTKKSITNYDYEWANPAGITKAEVEAIAGAKDPPTGGLENQLLAKKSAANYDYKWAAAGGSGGGLTAAEVEGLVGIGKTRWINVLNYGAVGNGTTNDTKAIQLAINALPSTGGVLYFPPGYNFLVGQVLAEGITEAEANSSASTLTPVKNMTIMGYGATLTQRTGYLHPLLWLEQGHAGDVGNITILGVKFVGAGAGGGEYSAPVWLVNTHDVTIRDCFAENFNAGGFNIYDGARLFLYNNRVKKCAVAGGGNFITIAESAVAGHPITDIVIAGNHMDECNTICIQVSNGNEPPPVPNTEELRAVVANNVCRSTAGGGGGIWIELGAHSRAHKIIIANNQCFNESTALESSGITIADSATEKNKAVNAAQDIAVTGNVIQSLLGSGIFCQADRALIANNVITSKIYPLNCGTPEHKITNLVITGNILRTLSTSTGASWIRFVEHLQLTDNIILGEGATGAKGLYIYECLWAKISGNKIASFASVGGIHLEKCANFLIDNNWIYNCSTAGILCSNTATSTPFSVIRDNFIVDDRGGSKKMVNGVSTSGGGPQVATLHNIIEGMSGTALSGEFHAAPTLF